MSNKKEASSRSTENLPLSDQMSASPTWSHQLPDGIERHAADLFKEKLDQLYHPDLIVLPLTPEGESEREWLVNYHHDSDGKLVHQSILRYGAEECNFEFEGVTYLAILVNND